MNARINFRAGPHAKAWHDTSGSTVFLEAINAALLHMVETQDPKQAHTNSYRLEGAREYMGILMNLTTPIEPRVRVNQNLVTNQ